MCWDGEGCYFNHAKVLSRPPDSSAGPNKDHIISTDLRLLAQACPSHKAPGGGLEVPQVFFFFPPSPDDTDHRATHTHSPPFSVVLAKLQAIGRARQWKGRHTHAYTPTPPR